MISLRWTLAHSAVLDDAVEHRRRITGGPLTADPARGYVRLSMPMAPPEWLAACRDAWLRRDAAAAAALFTEDATYAQQPYQEAFASRAGLRDYWARVTAT
jgi:hypothetical protein